MRVYDGKCLRMHANVYVSNFENYFKSVNDTAYRFCLPGKNKENKFQVTVFEFNCHIACEEVLKTIVQIQTIDQEALTFSQRKKRQVSITYII